MSPAPNALARACCPVVSITTSVPEAGVTDMKEAGRRTPETQGVATGHLPGFLKRPNIRIFCQSQEGQTPSWCLLP